VGSTRKLALQKIQIAAKRPAAMPMGAPQFGHVT